MCTRSKIVQTYVNAHARVEYQATQMNKQGNPLPFARTETSTLALRLIRVIPVSDGWVYLTRF